ncbi:MAG: adenylosuccinate lyase [Candidatus Paceibacterota bacterium]|jgi:adenylosuccinate lyase
MLKRYSQSEMEFIWSELNKFLTWFRVETTVLGVRRDRGEFKYPVPPDMIDKIVIDPREINRLEKGWIERGVKKEGIGHDVIAFLMHVSPQIPEGLRSWLHRGLTSYDIVDTALALQMRDSIDVITMGVGRLMGVLKRRAYEFKYTPEIGRTHGIHAEPITFGVKLANWYAELVRHSWRLVQAREEVSVGKLSGAVGMYTIDPKIEELVCARLGLKPIIATQIISRDVAAVYMSTLANLAASIGKISVNLRLLSQTEIREVMEPFGTTQKGSSAMPHKKNPVGSENISGLMRVPGVNYLVALENLANCWHERSLDNSGAERVIFADSSILVDYALARLTGIIENMRVFPNKMMRNLDVTKGLIFSQDVMMLVAEKSNFPREDAHTIVRSVALKCWGDETDFFDALCEEAEVMAYVTRDELRACFNLDAKLKNVDYIFNRVFGG